MKEKLFAFLLSFNSFVFSQNKDVIEFMGIPVDGSKTEIIEKLEAKGFVYNKEHDYLIGEFNGLNSLISISTNKNKVWRIMVVDANSVGETAIKIRFNELLKQFFHSGKYIGSLNNMEIPDDEDLGYEISINDKRYEAAYYQIPTDINKKSIEKEIREILLTRYSEEEIDNPTEEISIDISSTTYAYLVEKFKNNSVWFMVGNLYGKYYISLFYDNKLNEAKGEDL